MRSQSVRCFEEEETNCPWSIMGGRQWFLRGPFLLFFFCSSFSFFLFFFFFLLDNCPWKKSLLLTKKSLKRKKSLDAPKKNWKAKWAMLTKKNWKDKRVSVLTKKICFTSLGELSDLTLGVCWSGLTGRAAGGSNPSLVLPTSPYSAPASQSQVLHALGAE